jgi:hypothetical protein
MKPPRRNTAQGIPALTPDFSKAPTQPTLSGLLTRSELVGLVAELKGQVGSLTRQVTNLRRRHDATETALTKYNGILEAANEELREAFKTLDKPLVPGPSKGKR